MDTTFSLSHSERLRNRGALRRLFESGRSGFVYPIRYMWFAEQSTTTAATEAEVMFSVPKRLHKRANKRHLLRRRTKEAYRLNKSIILGSGKPLDIDIALIYSAKEQHSYKTIDNAVRKILTNIAKDL